MTRRFLPLLALASITFQQPAWSQPGQLQPPSAANSGELSPLAALLEKAAQQSEMRTLMTEEFKKKLAPGPVVADFERGGVDLTAALPAASGGSADTVLLDASDPMPTIVDFRKRTISFGLDYLVHNLAGKAVTSASETTIMPVAPGLWVVIEFSMTKRGNAHCSGKQFHVALHANRPIDSLSENEFAVLFIVMESIRQVENIEVCSVYSREKDGSFISNEYRPDGTSLPGLFDPEIKLKAVRYADAMKELAKVNPAEKIFD